MRVRSAWPSRPLPHSLRDSALPRHCLATKEGTSFFFCVCFIFEVRSVLEVLKDNPREGAPDVSLALGYATPQSREAYVRMACNHSCVRALVGSGAKEDNGALKGH